MAGTFKRITQAKTKPRPLSREIHKSGMHPAKPKKKGGK